MIPDPLKPMAYNRYMYVYGNPIKYEDPSGHFLVSAFIAGAALFTIGATSDDAFIQKAGMLTGSLLMMGAGGASFSLQAVTLEHGAMVGFTTDFISSGGDLGEGVQGAITSAISASLSAGVAETFGHGWSIEGAIAHGATQGFVSKLRGQSGRSGFISGFVGKVSGSLSNSYFGGETTADTIGSTTVATVFGGLASQATGGDFTEGALRAAFVHLFNEIADYIPEGNQAEKDYPILRFFNSITRAIFRYAPNEVRISLSGSGGAGHGGTFEPVGLTLAHNPSKPPYTGWSFGSFQTVGGGGYAGADIGIELNAGFSENIHIKDIGGYGTIIGGSIDVLGFANGGYEMTISQSGAAPLHNVSAGAYGNPFVAGDLHMFFAHTWVQTWGEW